MSRVKTSSNQILLFPQSAADVCAAPDVDSDQNTPTPFVPPPGSSVVLCGTYRKDPDGLRKTFNLLRDSGFSILSPSNAFIETEKDGFVYMRHESTQTPNQIEGRHLDAILKAEFVWLFAPGGYVGPTGALEVGFAHANGIPVYSDTHLSDTTIREFVEVVDSPSTVQDRFLKHAVLPPSPAVKSFQNYYRRAAVQRGYAKEDAKDCLMLMVEEVGELAKALRKSLKITRHGPKIINQEGLELADVFLYVVHMANILRIDLPSVVQEKELLNIKKFIHGK